jgi:hypothetical protein
MTLPEDCALMPQPVPLEHAYTFGGFSDTYALGHYARVIDAFPAADDPLHAAHPAIAFKLLRPEHMAPAEGETGADALRWEVRAFAHEADLLARVHDAQAVAALVDCGFISGAGEMPGGDAQIVRFGRDAAGFAAALAEWVLQGWRPFLGLERLSRTDNLFYAMRTDKGGMRRRLPTEEGLSLALQFAGLLRLFHLRGIAYLDHKLEHLFWDGTTLRLIDLNSSRALDRTEADRAQAAGYRALDVHHLCVGILYPIFTGLSPQKGAIRPQPGSAVEVENRYRDVAELDFGVEPALSRALCDLIQAGAALQIADAADLQRGLQAVASGYGWEFPGHYTRAGTRAARDEMRAGLAALREGEALLRAARDRFRDAAVADEVTAEMEDELRRLAKAVNDVLAVRVIP